VLRRRDRRVPDLRSPAEVDDEIAALLPAAYDTSPE